MKIVLATMQLGPAYPHGTERYVESLGSELRARGHEVLFLAGDPQSGVARAFGEARTADTRLYHHPVGGWLTVEGAVADAGAWLERDRPDVVHLANPAHIGVAAAVAAERLGIPVVVTAMDFWWICPRATLLREGVETCDGTPGWRDCLRCISSDHPRRALRVLGHVPDVAADLSLAIYAAGATARHGRSERRREAALWKHRRTLLADRLDRVDAIIFPSPATRDAIAPALSHTRTSLVPYGLGPEWFEDERPQSAPGTALPAPEALTLGYAGSLQHHKGPHLLLEAVRRLGWHRTRVRIAGALCGRYGRRLEREARGLDVEFTGLLGRHEMRAFHRTLDVLAVTSLWPENLPFSMLEGLASGTTVVASNVAGIAHCIGDERLLYEPGDATDLARALTAAREGVRSGSPAAVSTLAAMTDATLEIYDRAISRRVGAPGSRS